MTVSRTAASCSNKLQQAALVQSLREGSGVIHVIDPYKVTIGEACAKIAFLASYGMPFCIVASTDRADIEHILPVYVEGLVRSTKLPVLTHFQAQEGSGYPAAPSAAGILLTSILNSANPYYSSLSRNRLSVTESNLTDLNAKTFHCAGLTFGIDQKSSKYMAALPFGITEPGWFDRFEHLLLEEPPDVLYLYSRHEVLKPHICAHVRERVDPRIPIFASGCVQTQKQAKALLCAGARYVVVGTALEHENWRVHARNLFGGIDWNLA